MLIPAASSSTIVLSGPWSIELISTIGVCRATIASSSADEVAVWQLEDRPVDSRFTEHAV